MIHVLLAFILLLMAFTPTMPPLADTPPHDSVADTTDDAVRANVLEAYGKLPILFVHNQGELSDTVEYYARASGQTLYFTDDGIVFDLIRYEQADDVDLADRNAERLVFSLDFLGANGSPVIQGGDKDTAVVNYLIGNDPENWHTDIPTCREVAYREIYPNIDLRLYGKEGVLEYEFVVRPGANVNDVALAYTGVDSLAIESGELVASTAFGDMKQTQPYIYQRIGDEVVEVDGGFKLAGGNTYGFEVAAYDAAYPLIIDPTLAYSTFLGGAGPDYGQGIALDTSGCAYVTGYTPSADFPMQNSYNGTFGGALDAFITKLSASGSSLVYSTYLGGSGDDRGNSIAVDSSFCAYVTGHTNSTNFPMQNSYNSTGGGSYDAFVTKFNTAGNTLAYSTFLGGGGGDCGYGIAVDASGCAYVTGETASADFPIGATTYNGTWGGNYDAFVTKFTAAGDNLTYSTFLGGAGADYGRGVAVDAAGCAYVTGYTGSIDFPTQNPYHPALDGFCDAFVTKLGAPGNTLIYSTFLGGAGPDYGQGIAVDAANCAYVTGYTGSIDFPTQNPYNGTCSGPWDAFVTKFTAAGNTLVYSTFLGGSGANGDHGRGIAVDAANCAYVTGLTDSIDFPMQNPYQGTYGGVIDAFVTKFNTAGNTLAYSTFLGGGSSDCGYGIAVDAANCAYVTGYTNSADFPTQNAYQGTFGGGTRDAFVTKLGDPDITVNPLTIDFGSVAVGSSSPAQTVTVTNDGCGILTVGTITLGGTNAGEFAIQNDNCSGQTLAPGASATLQVVFTPTSAGARTATLSIPSNDPDEPTVNVTLSGTGTQAAAPAQRRVSPSMGAPTQLPPSMTTQYLAVNPQQQYAGQPVTITTNVSNTGGSTGQYTVTLMINGQVEETRLVSVGAQSALPVKFIVTRDVPGTYTVTIGNQQSSFSVLDTSGTAGSPTSSGLIAIVLVVILVLLTAVVLLLAFRRPAW